MAAYRNYYNRRKSFFSCHKKWALIFPCLYLLCSTLTIACDRQHQRHHQKDIYVDQLEKSAIERKAASISGVTCPNCLGAGEPLKVEESGGGGEDHLRLEAIKRQILSKLGMRHKPNITHNLPKEVILATLDRADNSEYTRNYYDFSENVSTTSSRTFSANSENSANSVVLEDFDDFYGRTSEIISFAEQGYRVNQNRLLEFRVSPESGHQAGQEFRVRTATLWLKAELVRHRQPAQCRSTEIYVFKIISRLTESITLTSQDFDRVASDPMVLTLHESSSGWQKIDLTETVKAWLAEPHPQEKLQLFVDCSCCSNWYVHLFNSGSLQSNRPFLQIRTDPNTTKRVRRRALDCSPEAGNACCKQRFFVNFKQLGWDDWVIAPHGYYANYCRGDCGHHRTPDTYVTYHTHVIEEVRKTHHLSGMQPCCAPLKFSSMSLIYYGPDLTIIKRDLPKMVVDECGCP